MLEHLLTLDPKDFCPEKPSSSPVDMLEARIKTVDLFESMGVPPDEEVIGDAIRSAAQHAFHTITATSTDAQKKAAIAALNTPPAVKHLVGMLTAYDWQFIEQAQELRGYTVAKIVEETTHPDARIRLRALEMLGKVTEVALFTERIEIKKLDMSDADLEKALREKLGRLLPGEYTKEVTPA